MHSLLPEADFARAPGPALRDGQNWAVLILRLLTLWPDAGLRRRLGAAAADPVHPRGHSVLDMWFPRPLSAVPTGSSGSRSPWQGCPLLSWGSPGALRRCRSSGCCEEAGPRTSKPWAEALFCWGDGHSLQALPHAGVGALGDKAPDVPPTSPRAAGPASAWGAHWGGCGGEHLGAAAPGGH